MHGVGCKPLRKDLHHFGYSILYTCQKSFDNCFDSFISLPQSPIRKSLKKINPVVGDQQGNQTDHSLLSFHRQFFTCQVQPWSTRSCARKAPGMRSRYMWSEERYQVSWTRFWVSRMAGFPSIYRLYMYIYRDMRIYFVFEKNYNHWHIRNWWGYIGQTRAELFWWKSCSIKAMSVFFNFTKAFVFDWSIWSLVFCCLHPMHSLCRQESVSQAIDLFSLVPGSTLGKVHFWKGKRLYWAI